MNLSAPILSLVRAVMRAEASSSVRARYRCNFCGAAVRRFLPYRRGWASVPPLMRELRIIGSDVAHFECPACGCHDRERHLLLYLQASGLLQALQGAAVLHIAPEERLQQTFENAGLQRYVRGDLFPSRPQIQRVDLEDTSFDDASFDFVIANHVLEHVSDVNRALTEISRVLRPGGYAILQTPYASVLSRTFEDPAVQTPAARLHAFGQEDHCRLFGRDIFERFATRGLCSRVQSHATLLPEVDSILHGVNRDEPFFLFQKGAGPTSAPSEAQKLLPALPVLGDRPPVVSVVCITYNHERFISQALDSFFAQQVPFPVEIVVGDDCSTDGTVGVVEKYMQRNPGRITLLRTGFNLGMAQNFRRTLKASRGRYIAICEGDDFWEDPTKLAQQVEFLDANPDFVLAFHDARVMDSTGLRGDIQLPRELQRDATGAELQRARSLSTLTVCFRNILPDIPTELQQAPALDLCLWSALGQFGAGKYMPTIRPAVYRVHEGGVFSMQSERNRLAMTARVYLCLSQYHARRGDFVLEEHFRFTAASIVGRQLAAVSQRMLARNLLSDLWRKAKVWLAARVGRPS